MGRVFSSTGNPISRMTEEKEEPGILKGLLQSAAQPFLKVAETGRQAISDIGTLAVGGKEDIARRARELETSAPARPTSFGILGTATPIGYDAQGKKLPVLQNLAQAVGIGLEAGANVIGGTGATQAGKVAFKETLKAGIKTAAKTGFKSGVVFGAGTGIRKEAEEPSSSVAETSFNVAYDALTSGILGGIGAGTLAGTTALGGAGIRRVMEFVHPAFKETKINQLIASNAARFRKALNLNKTQRVIENRSGKDVSQFLAEEGLVLDVKSNRLVNDELIDALDFKAESENAAFGRLLKDSGNFVKLSDVRNAVLTGLRGFGTAIKKEFSDVEDELVVLLEQFKNAPKDASGNVLIPVDVANGIKKFYWNQGRFNRLATPDQQSRAALSRRIGTAFKEAIENAVDDADVQAFNQRLGDLQNAIFMLEERNGMVVPGGMLGKFFARSIGAAIGAPAGGAPGAITGAFTADKIADILQNPKITTAFARQYLKILKSQGKQELVDQITDILQKRGAERASRKLLEASKTIFAEPFKGVPPSTVKAVPAEIIEEIPNIPLVQTGKKIFGSGIKK